MSGNTGLGDPRVILAAPPLVVWVVLATGSSNAQAFDAPAGRPIANFSFNADVWVSYGTTAAAIPTTTSTASTTANAELNPSTRNLGSTVACTGISLASEVAAKGSISWYAK